jgi:hypothetical protein
MIVSYMDRIVRVYGWSSNTGSSSTPSQTAIGTTGKDTKTATGSAYNYSFQENGKLVLEHSWEMPDLVTQCSLF